MKQDMYNTPGMHEEDRRTNDNGRNRKALLILIGVAAVLIGVVLVWKTIQMNSLRSKAENEQQRLKDEARIALVQAH